MTSIIVLDPTSERDPEHRQPLSRPESLQGLTVGLLDIAKAQGKEFLDRVEEHLQKLGATIVRYRKPTFTRIAPLELKQQIASECDVVIEGLAD
jgi:hypothetical protein